MRGFTRGHSLSVFAERLVTFETAGGSRARDRAATTPLPLAVEGSEHIDRETLSTTALTPQNIMQGGVMDIIVFMRLFFTRHGHNRQLKYTIQLIC